MANALPDFPGFQCNDTGGIGPRWKKWLARFEILLVAMAVPDGDDDRKRALLLHYMGSECYDIYDTLREDSDRYAAVKRKLTEHFTPKSNKDYERYVFRNTTQREGETVAQY